MPEDKDLTATDKIPSNSKEPNEIKYTLSHIAYEAKWVAYLANCAVESIEEAEQMGVTLNPRVSQITEIIQEHRPTLKILEKEIEKLHNERWSSVVDFFDKQEGKNRFSVDERRETLHGVTDERGEDS